MSAKAPQATFANLITQRLDLRQQLVLAVREERRNLHGRAELLVRLIDQEPFRLRHGGLEQRTARGSHVHRIEIPAVLHLRHVGEAEAFEMEFHLRLHVMILHFEGAVVWNPLAIYPASGGQVRIDAEVDDRAAPALTDLVAHITPVGLAGLAVPAVLHELIRTLAIAHRDRDAVGALDAVLLGNRAVGVRSARVLRGRHQLVLDPTGMIEGEDALSEALARLHGKAPLTQVPLPEPQRAFRYGQAYAADLATALA